MVNHMLKQLRAAIEIESHPNAKARMIKAVGLLEESDRCWVMPGKQIDAQRLDREAVSILQNLLDPL